MERGHGGVENGGCGGGEWEVWGYGGMGGASLWKQTSEVFSAEQLLLSLSNGMHGCWQAGEQVNI